MATLEILNVSEAPSGDQLLGSVVDRPKTGDHTSGYLLHIVGWALGRNSPVTAVEVIHRGSVIQVAPVYEPRLDVAAVHPQVPAAKTCGFRAVVSVLGLEPEFDLRLEAVLDGASRVAIGSVRGRHEPLRSSFEARVAPIVVTCLPRAGSTWLMKMLSAHPQVVVFQRYPYESSPARYWMRLLELILEPVSITQAVAHPTELAWDATYNPFYDQEIADQPALGEWLGRTQIERLASFCQKNIEDWYLAVAHGQGQDQPLYFGEKHLWPGRIGDLMSELYPQMKEVFLVRDFRDMVCSILAFDEARDYSGFRRPAGITDEQYVEESLAQAVEEFRKSWEARQSRSHLVRYEDLVRKPSDVLAGLLGYLGLDASSEDVGELLASASEETDELRSHRTSRDLGASVGRWRYEHDESFRALCQETFAPALRAFGYPES